MRRSVFMGTSAERKTRVEPFVGAGVHGAQQLARSRGVGWSEARANVGRGVRTVFLLLNRAADCCRLRQETREDADAGRLGHTFGSLRPRIE